MRNKVIFNDGTATFEDSFSLILYRLLNWLKSTDKFMATSTTLIMGPEVVNLERALPFKISSGNGYSYKLMLDSHVNLIKLIKKTTHCISRVVDGKRRKMVASAFGKDQSGGSATRPTVEDLKYLFMV
ncbi:hypothetical protein NC653_040538 [Populus alba x Populus x berolinensis]|uniref:Uncharacterized protein n=1 Tax=Populus alba x Populus x berolinensis TaxID=444605 RepID=A0AAD6L6G4_9ROSI|nr:hypothetical protein NC653_040538 [Populus alba x Populus x berolinensis]